MLFVWGNWLWILVFFFFQLYMIPEIRSGVLSGDVGYVEEEDTDEKGVKEVNTQIFQNIPIFYCLQISSIYTIYELYF